MGTIITVSREYGAGGHSIARRVAQELGIEIYDRDIIRSAVKDTGLDTSIVEHEEEEISRGSAFLRMIAPAAYVDQREAIHEIERKAILMLAAKGSCVILGRCADAILDEANVDTLNVFIYADQLHRAARVGELLGSSYDGWFCIEHFGAPDMLEYTRQSVANIKAAWSPTFDEVLSSRRSIRSYDASKKISEAEVRELMKAVQEAPSWANQQPTKYYVAITPEARCRSRDGGGEQGQNHGRARADSLHLRPRQVRLLQRPANQ